MTKTLGIYFSDEELMGYPFHKAEYFEIYEWIFDELGKRGARVFIVRGKSYLGEGRFNNVSRFENGEIKKVEGEVKVDLIFNRDDKNTIPEIRDCAIINHPDLDRLCTDKLETFKEFPELSPRTETLGNFTHFGEVVNEWGLKPEEKVVLKKNFETEGRGIYIMPLAEVTEGLYEDWNGILLQEFIDSSVGISGLTDGLHDLRVTVVNGVPINSFLRVPKAGSYLANVAQGGKGISVNLEDVPSEVLSLVLQIEKKLDHFKPSLYAADFMNSPRGYKLVELNSRPGVQHPHWSGTYQKYNDAVVEMLWGALKSL